MEYYRLERADPPPERPHEPRLALTHLGLSSADLAELLPQIAELPGLEELVVVEPGLRTLPDEISLLTGLRRLQLSGCALTALPDAIGRLTSLETLQVDDNQLTALPDAVGSLTGLRHLYAWFNQLSDLPETLDRLVALESLGLSSNPFTDRPAVLDRLPVGTQVDIHPSSEQPPVEVEVPDTSGDWPSWAADPFGGDRLWAGYHTYYVHGDGPEVWVEGFAAVQANDGVAAVGSYLAQIDAGRQHGPIEVRLEVADTLPRPVGVAGAFDLLLPDGSLVVSGFEGNGSRRHDFGRPTRCRVLVEVAGRDVAFENAGHADDEAGLERHRITVVATDRERPRWRSTVIDRIGGSLASSTAHVAGWDASAEP